MKTENIKIYVIVVTFNGAKWIHKCLSSIKSSEIPVHALVIDNNSEDNTVKIIEQNYPKAELIKSDKNLGFGQGNNIGLRKAIEDNADYVFLLNQDAWIEPNTIKKLVSLHFKNPGYGIISPTHYNGAGNSLEYKFSEYISPFFTDEIISDFFLKKPKELYPTKFVNAAAWLISRACFTKVGGFDPIFYHYGEDEDYIQRMNMKGYKIGIATGTVIYHDNNFSYDNVNENHNRQLIISILQLKNLESPLRRNLLIFFKSNIDQITSLLLYRRFKQAWFRVKVMSSVILLMKKIKLSRKKSLLNQAFLEL